MPLVTYDDVLPWARGIKEQTLTRRMPVWHAARGFGMFANDPTLSPFETALLVAWVDGGRPAGAGATGPTGASGATGAVLRGARGASGTTDVVLRGARGASGATVAVLQGARGASGAGAKGAGATGAGATGARAGVVIGGGTGWITGWTFVPADPLIASATFTSADRTPIGTWVAGDRPVHLPAGSAIRIVSPVHVDVRRRKATDYERPVATRPFRLLVTRLATKPEDARSWPERRVWTERMTCGDTLGSAEASIVAVRPLLTARESAQIAVERLGGSPPVLLGWFRDFEPDYARIYWLAKPVEFAAGARFASDAPCQLEITLSAPR
jgi:hypothetical protein